jgi:hypothetical protein
MPLTREQMLEQDRACRVYQARADDALEAWGARAPGPVVSDSPDNPEKYRRELLYLAKKRLPEDHEFRNFQVKHIPLDVFEVVEPQIYAECKKAASRNDSVPPGEMRMVKTKNPQNGQEMISFYGRERLIAARALRLSICSADRCRSCSPACPHRSNTSGPANFAHWQ